MARAAAAALQVDHLMFGASNLDKGIGYLEQRTGVRATFGGQHPNRGTQNALLSLGSRQYLEIIAPDPAQAEVRGDRVDVLRSLAEPRLLTWAAGTTDIQSVERRVVAAGYESGGIAPGSRKRPDAVLLEWRSFTAKGHDGDVVPFFIEWSSASAHPATDSPKGCALLELRLEHPTPDTVNRLLEAMGLEIRATRGTLPRLLARLRTPKGEVELA